MAIAPTGSIFRIIGRIGARMETGFSAMNIYGVINGVFGSDERAVVGSYKMFTTEPTF
jgi:hypothetical protein